MPSMHNNALSILVIGATGGTGREVMKQLYEHADNLRVHAFCRDPDKLNKSCNTCYHSVVKGDARSTNDLSRAMTEVHADVVVVSVGNGESVAKSDIRTASACALVQALTTQPNLGHVRVIVVSSTGAGSSEIILGMGLGKLIEYHLRHVLKDHTGQEETFLSTMKNRTFIVRATALTDGQPAKKVVEFGDKVKSPSIKTDRSDLARYIVENIVGDRDDDSSSYGKIVNITGVKK